MITTRKKELNVRFLSSPAPSKLALGVEDRRIPDGSFSASSNWNRGFAPKRARLNAVKRGRLYGAWAARRSNRAQWLLVDITKLARVVGFATQGRQDYNQWVMSLRISYSRDGIRFHYYTERRRPKVSYQRGGVRSWQMSRNARNRRNNRCLLFLRLGLILKRLLFSCRKIGKLTKP